MSSISNRVALCSGVHDVVYEWQDRYEEATRQLGQWIKDGLLKYRESIGEGLENAPELFRGLLKGKNFGKQLVKVAEEEI